jgi:hypothetical protein
MSRYLGEGEKSLKLSYKLNEQGFVQEEKELVGTTCSLLGMGRDGIPNFLTLITKRCSTKRKNTTFHTHFDLLI